MFSPATNTTMAFFGGFPVVYGGVPQVVFDGSVPPHIIMQMGGVMAQAPDVFVGRPMVMVDDRALIRDEYRTRMMEINSLKRVLCRLTEARGVNLTIGEPGVVRGTISCETHAQLAEMDRYIVKLRDCIRRLT